MKTKDSKLPHNLNYHMHSQNICKIFFFTDINFKQQKLPECPLMYWGQDKMAPNFLMTFSNSFSRTKMHEWILIKISLFTFRQATSHYLNERWLVYWHIYASLGPNELIERWSLISIRIPSIKMKRSHEPLILMMGIPILVKTISTNIKIP